MAQDSYNPGDWWFPGEEAWWCGCTLHRVAHAGLPGRTLHVTLSAAVAQQCRDAACVHQIEPESTFLLFLNQPPQFKLDPRLARMLGIHTQTRPVIIQALWQYVKTHKLQDPHEREFINCDKYLQQVRGSSTYIKLGIIYDCSIKLGGSSLIVALNISCSEYETLHLFSLSFPSLYGGSECFWVTDRFLFVLAEGKGQL